MLYNWNKSALKMLLLNLYYNYIYLGSTIGSDHEKKIVRVAHGRHPDQLALSEAEGNDRMQ